MSLNKKVLEIRKQITDCKNIVMFFDGDCDGFTSFLQLKNKWKKKIKKGFAFPKQEKYQLELINFIDESYEDENDLIIFFDIPIISKNFLEDRKVRSKKIIWVDHHDVDNFEILKKNKNINYLNPLDFDKKDNRPSSFLAYLIADLKENSPLASIGILGDFFLLEPLKDFYKFDKILFKILFNLDDKKREEIFNVIGKNKNYIERTQRESNYIEYLTNETLFSKVKIFFNSLVCLKFDDLNKAINYLCSTKIEQIIVKIDLEEDIFPFDVFLENYKKMDKIYKKILKKHNSKIKVNTYIKKIKELIFKKTDENKIRQKDIFFDEYYSKIGFTKILIERLAYDVKDKKIFILAHLKNNNPFVKCSLRGKGKNVLLILKNIQKELDIKGGGHKYACACSMDRKTYSKFKKKIEELE